MVIFCTLSFYIIYLHLYFFFEQQRNTSNYWSESHTIFIKAIVLCRNYDEVIKTANYLNGKEY
jgi:hypothetical protein